MSQQVLKCPLCHNKYYEKPQLYSHMRSDHQTELGDMTPAQVYFNYKYHKTRGSCIICHKPTNWNESTERYERLCGDPGCRERYREMFRERMLKKYGKDTLLDDPEQQKRMLLNRKISGTYVWKNGYSHSYTGDYERDFLEFLEKLVLWDSPSDILSRRYHTFLYS